MKTPIEAGNWVLFMGNLFVVKEIIYRKPSYCEWNSPMSIPYSKWRTLVEDGCPVRFAKIEAVCDVQKHVKEYLHDIQNIVVCYSLKRINPISAKKRGFLKR